MHVSHLFDQLGHFPDQNPPQRTIGLEWLSH